MQTLRLSLVILAVGIAACSDEQPNDDHRVKDRTGEIDAGTPTFGIYNTLKVMRAVVEVGDKVERPFFDADGRVLIVNGENVEVYEYDSKEDVDKAAATIAPDGSIGGQPAWPAPPHFYRTERVIVLYLGSNANTMSVLESSTGKQFAGG